MTKYVVFTLHTNNYIVHNAFVQQVEHMRDWTSSVKILQWSILCVRIVYEFSVKKNINMFVGTDEICRGNESNKVL